MRAAAVALLLAALAWIAPAHAQALVAVPPVARVTDQTGTLRPEQIAALEQKLTALEQRKGSQLAVLIVPTTQPEDIAQFGVRVAEAWKLGRKGVDDGAVLIVALQDRRMRIEVGYGLEGVITDLASNRILDEFLRPSFRAGDFYGGIDAAVDKMIGLVDGEPLPEPKHDEWSGKANGLANGLGALLPVLLIFGLVAGPILRKILGRPLGSIATGGLAGFIAYLLVGVLAISIFAGIIGFIVTLIGGLGGGGPWSSGRRGGGFGGWGGGGLGGGLGGGGGWGGGGGGGWSGGGGGFGGGGASGSW